jgi:hypothetical protein
MRNRNISIAEVGSVQVPVLVFPSAKSGIGLAATLNFPPRLPAAAPAVKKRGRGQRQRPIPLLVPVAHQPLDYPSSKSQCFNTNPLKKKLSSSLTRVALILQQKSIWEKRWWDCIAVRCSGRRCASVPRPDSPDSWTSPPLRPSCPAAGETARSPVSTSSVICDELFFMKC